MQVNGKCDVLSDIFSKQKGEIHCYDRNGDAVDFTVVPGDTPILSAEWFEEGNEIFYEITLDYIAPKDQLESKILEIAEGLKRVNSVDYVCDALKVLADNEYSLLWDLVDDFECNGHKISVKDSSQFKSVIIDGVYQRIGGNTTIQDMDGTIYKDPLDYVRKLLSTKKTDESRFMADSKEEIRENLYKRAKGLDNLTEAQDRVIRTFNKTDEAYKNLEAAAALMHRFTGKDYHIGDTYFDYGQGWKWTTILEDSSDWGGVQVLYPKAQEEIIFANSATDLGKAVDGWIAHHKKYSMLPSKDSEKD